MTIDDTCTVTAVLPVFTAYVQVGKHPGSSDPGEQQDTHTATA